MSAKPPLLDGDQIAAHVAHLSREPFKQVLELFLRAASGVEDFGQFARRFPDRWAQGLTMLAKLSGINKRLELDHSHTLDAVALSQMSDMELHRHLGGLLEKMGVDLGEVRLPTLTNGGGKAGK